VEVEQINSTMLTHVTRILVLTYFTFIKIISHRRQNIIINHLRIGHILITHQRLITKEESTKWNTCGVQLTVMHILTEYHNHQNDSKETLCSEKLYEMISPDLSKFIIYVSFKKSSIFRKGLVLYYNIFRI
jgi:hypothetical protein